jgi:two-component system, OmpR family, alkaline phosphatase synthesis response regulator PhoP
MEVKRKITAELPYTAEPETGEDAMAAKKRVLVVDNDAKTVKLVNDYLKHDGYGMLTTCDGMEALRIAREGQPDLIVLDLMLPGVDVSEVCRRLIEESDVQIIMLTAKTTENECLAGLDVDTDECVAKPFSPRELAAMVHTLLLGLSNQMLMHVPEEINCGELTINYRKNEANIAGTLLTLTPIEFNLLGILAREPERVFSRAQLIEMSFGHDLEGFDRSIDVHIYNLRQKLKAIPGHSIQIKTV